MELNVYNQKGAVHGTVSVADALVAAPMNADLVWQVATSQMSNKRKVLAHTKTRSEVRGGGRKPWRQKGTGRARHGSTRSPIWIGGGVAHGPSKDVDFTKTISKSVARKALATIISARVQDGGLVIVDAINISSGKTKDGAQFIASLSKQFTQPASGRMLVVLGGGIGDASTVRAFANIPEVQTIRAQDLNALTILGFSRIITTADALAVAEKTFLKKN